MFFSKEIQRKKATKLINSHNDLIIQDSQEVKGDILVGPISSKSELVKNSSYKDRLYNYGNQLNLGSLKSQNDLIPSLNKSIKIIGEELCNTKDQTLINHLWSNHVSTIYAQQGKNGYLPTEFNRKDHTKMLDRLRSYFAPPFFVKKHYIMSDIPDSYLVLAHSDLSDDIRETFGNNFEEEHQYPSVEGEFGVDHSFNFSQGAYLVITHNDLYTDIQRVFGNRFKPAYIPLPYLFQNYYSEEQIGYEKQAIFVLTPNSPMER